MKTLKRSTSQQDPRSFAQLRYDLTKNLFAVLCLCGIELDKVLRKEQMNDNLRDLYLCANEANAALRIMFAGYDGTEPNIQPCSEKELILPANKRPSAN